MELLKEDVDGQTQLQNIVAERRFRFAGNIIRIASERPMCQTLFSFCEIEKLDAMFVDRRVMRREYKWCDNASSQLTSTLRHDPCKLQCKLNAAVLMF